MKRVSLFIIGVFLIIFLVLFFINNSSSNDIIEGINGGQHLHRHRRGWVRGPYRGRGPYRRRGPYRGRGWYGGNVGYKYQQPHYNRPYVPWWTTAYWFGGVCKKGCTSIGNNNWGCQYPGNGVNECVFAHDCYGCGI